MKLDAINMEQWFASEFAEKIVAEKNLVQNVATLYALRKEITSIFE
jgi:hypothetical protein